MHIRCMIGKHEAIPSTLWNDGYFFSKCRHCQCDMINRGGPWQRVPKGYAVRWRPRTERDIQWDKPFRSKIDNLKLSDLLLGNPSDPQSSSSGVAG